MQECSKCGLIKSLTHFHNRRDRKNGKNSMCKDCVAKRNAEYVRDNKELVAERKRLWEAKNSERNKEIRKKYREENRDLILARKKKYRDENKESVRKQRKKYANANREKLIEEKADYYRNNQERLKQKRKAYYRANRLMVLQKCKEYAAKHADSIRERKARWRAGSPKGKAAVARGNLLRRMAIKNTDGEIATKGQIATLIATTTHCVWCGVDLKTSGYQIDHHIPLARGGGHTFDNLRVICPTCNRKKSSKLPSVFQKELDEA